jgi:membrane protein
LSPEGRRKDALRRSEGLQARIREKTGPGSRFYNVMMRVVMGAWEDGFIHAGNLAYMTMLALFPFFIAVAAVFSAIGEQGHLDLSIDNVLTALPPKVAEVLAPVAHDAVAARHGGLLWVGGVFGLWSAASLIETIRDILRRAYGTRASGAFWHYRLGAVAIIVVAVMLMMLAFAAQVALTGAEQFVYRLLPVAREFTGWISLSRIVPAFAVFVALYVLFYTLTPSVYRFSKNPKWPGALFTALWWLAVTVVLPVILYRLGNYNRTYGSLAGIVIMLFFFWLVGFGLVIGAHLNAALAEPPEQGLKDPAEKTEETAWPV